MSTWTTNSFTDATSPIMEQLIFFHDYSMLILINITMFVLMIFINMFKNKFSNRFLLSGQSIETIWTIIPAMILLLIAFPSIQILYLLDETSNPSITIKAMGHQWYWSHEYLEMSKEKMTIIESYIINTDQNKDTFRLLEVDKSILIPYNTPIRMLVSSMDVIHSWTIPSLGIKIDAVPGRLNQINFIANRPGMFFGQCSEICGMNHSFMPISIISVPMNKFKSLISK